MLTTSSNQVSMLKRLIRFLVNVGARFTYLTRVERDKPMYSLEIRFHERNITLAKDQYEVMIKLADFMKAYAVYLENR